MSLFRKYICTYFTRKQLLSTQINNVANSNNSFQFKKSTRKVFPLESVKIQFSDFFSELNAGVRFSNEYWKSLRTRFEKSEIKEHLIDCNIFDLCAETKRMDAAISYFKYLYDNNNDIHLAIYGRYFRTVVLARYLGMEVDEKEVLQIYDKIRKEYPILDTITLAHCISALCITSRWKESLILYKELQKYAYPTLQVHKSLIDSAFQHSEPELAWNLINDISSKQTLPDALSISYLNYCSSEYQSSQDIISAVEKMFHFWGENNTYPSKDVVLRYLKITNWNAKETFMTNSGRCRECSNSLTKTKVTKNDCTELAAALIKSYTTGENLYATTTPKESKDFMKFVQKFKPFDIVIDILNVIAVTKPFKRPPMIDDLITPFLKDNKKVLIVGRRHLQNKLRNITRNNDENLKIFLLDNISKDDVYILYATLMSGQDACFVSRDLMRQHKFRLPERKLRQLFQTWQLSHQINVLSTSTGNVKYTKPKYYLQTAQKNATHWHIPYLNSSNVSDRSLEISKDSLLPHGWICVRHC